MSVLYHVRIIHSIEDYASLGPAIREAFVRQAREAAFAQLQKDINEYWEMVEERLEKMIPDAQDLIIYQDSFPMGSREKILAHFGHLCAGDLKSPNFRLVQKLLDKGAALEGTEDMNLVIEQAQLYQRAAVAASAEEQKKMLAAQAPRSREITRLRDIFIAQRIHDTLPESSKGILFIGRDHDVIAELEKLPKKFLWGNADSQISRKRLAKANSAYTKTCMDKDLRVGKNIYAPSAVGAGDSPPIQCHLKRSSAIRTSSHIFHQFSPIELNRTLMP